MRTRQKKTHHRHTKGKRRSEDYYRQSCGVITLSITPNSFLHMPENQKINVASTFKPILRANIHAPQNKSLRLELHPSFAHDLSVTRAHRPCSVSHPRIPKRRCAGCPNKSVTYLGGAPRTHLHDDLRQYEYSFHECLVPGLARMTAGGSPTGNGARGLDRTGPDRTGQVTS